MLPTIRARAPHLHGAGRYVTALPKAAQKKQVEWQTATEMLILTAKGQRLLMFATALLAATGSGYMIALYMAGIQQGSRSTL